MKLNPRIKQLWLDALRSGEYVQGKYILRSNQNTYCCLGVLGDVCVKENLAKWQYIDKKHRLNTIWGQSNANIPLDLQLKIGLDTDEGLVVKGKKRTLTILNDTDDYTFLQIADLIEEQC